MIIKLTSIVALVLLACLNAFSWGPIGHRCVGLIADASLSPRAKFAVQQLLGSSSLADVANWADAVRAGSSYKQTGWYHFEKIEDNTRFLNHLGAMPPWQKQKGGIVSAILVAIEKLKPTTNLTISEKADALKFLVHFVGDLHQPLHTGRPADNGGNKIPVTWFGYPTNLHGVWDSGMLYSGHSEIINSTRSIEIASYDYGLFLLKQNRNFPVDVHLALEDWLNESLAYRTAAYDTIFLSNQILYQNKNLPFVDRRIFEAGVRLGNLLNSLFENILLPPEHLNFFLQVESFLGNLVQLINLKP